MIRRRLLRPSWWFVLAAVLGSVAWFGTIRVAARGSSIPVLVAERDLPVGADPLAAGNGRWQPMPASAVLPGMVTDGTAVGARTTSAPVGAGEPITDAALGGAPGRPPAPLASGERAMSIPAVAAGAALPVLVPGARVDIVATSTDAGPRAIVIGAEVITVQSVDQSVGGDGAGAVLLRLSARDALRLSALIDRADGVRILPRPYAEESGR